MIYILAAVGALTVALLMWRAFGPDGGGPAGGSRFRDGMTDRTSAAKEWLEKRRNGGDTGKPRERPLAPDDDPEFLRRISEQQRNQRDPGDGNSGS